MKQDQKPQAKKTLMTELLGIWFILNFIALLALLASATGFSTNDATGAIFIFEEKITACPPDHSTLDHETNYCHAVDDMGHPIPSDTVPRADIHRQHNLLDYILTLLFFPAAIAMGLLLVLIKLLAAFWWLLMLEV